MNCQNVSIHYLQIKYHDLNSISECHLLCEYLSLFQDTEPTSREIGTQYEAKISVPEGMNANKRSTFNWMFDWL